MSYTSKVFSGEANEHIYYTIRLQGKKDYSTEYIKVELDKPLAEGDVISITAFRNKNNTTAISGALLRFENGNTAAVGSGTAFVNLNAEAYADGATVPNTLTYTVTADNAGSTTIELTRAETGTNLWITDFAVYSQEIDGIELSEVADQDMYTPFIGVQPLTVVEMDPWGMMGVVTDGTVFYPFMDTNEEFYAGAGIEGCWLGIKYSYLTFYKYTPAVATVVVPEVPAFNHGDAAITVAHGNYMKLTNLNVKNGVAMMHDDEDTEAIDIVDTFGVLEALENGKHTVTGMWLDQTPGMMNEGEEGSIMFVPFSHVERTGDLSSIEAIEAADADAIYYNLQGVRVDNPIKGNVYIRVAGEKASKVIVK